MSEETSHAATKPVMNYWSVSLKINFPQISQIAAQIAQIFLCQLRTQAQ